MRTATIAFPTFNRVDTLPQAVASALAQDYAALEVVICDNASTDVTEDYCRALAAADGRVRYVRHAENIGALGNFEAALAAASGEYFMWLADDDWIDPNYLTECIGALERGAVLAGGRAHWFGGDVELKVEAPLTLSAGTGTARVLEYYRRVTRNSVFYGVYRTATVRSLGSVPEPTGGDWMFVALAALTGPVETVETTAINRATGGASDTILGAGWAIPPGVVRHIVHGPGFAGLGKWRRSVLAAECGVILGWRVGVWFPLLAISRRALGDAGYRRLRSVYRKVGRLRSRSEMVSSPTSGQATASAGSSQRTPAEASGTYGVEIR